MSNIINFTPASYGKALIEQAAQSICISLPYRCGDERQALRDWQDDHDVEFGDEDQLLVWERVAAIEEAQK